MIQAAIIPGSLLNGKSFKFLAAAIALFWQATVFILYKHNATAPRLISEAKVYLQYCR